MRLVLQACHVRQLQPNIGAGMPDASAQQAEQAAQHAAFWEQHAHSPMCGRRKLVTSFCPSLAGLFDAKLALLLLLCGGIAAESEGTRTRGQPHLLMVGDPGTGKSRLMQSAAQLAPRHASAEW